MFMVIKYCFIIVFSKMKKTRKEATLISEFLLLALSLKMRKAWKPASRDWYSRCFCQDVAQHCSVDHI